MVQNARKHTRIKVLIPCAIRTPSPNPTQGWGRIHDISVGGVELNTYFRYLKGQLVFLTFNINNRFIFTNAKCRIVRAREEDGYIYAGISFDDVVDKEHLKEALQALLEGE